MGSPDPTCLARSNSAEPAPAATFVHPHIRRSDAAAKGSQTLWFIPGANKAGAHAHGCVRGVDSVSRGGLQPAAVLTAVLVWPARSCASCESRDGHGVIQAGLSGGSS